MGKYDEAMYEYLEDNERFAELYNAAAFHGEVVLRSDMLESDDGRYVFVESDDEKHVYEKANGRKGVSQRAGSKELGEKKVWSQTRFRDLKKRLKSGGWLAITAIENQEAIDYTMPLRIMEYDLLEYVKQLKRMKKDKAGRLKAEGIKANNWDTRFEKEDKLFPVYSLCFYHGTDEWNGPKSLKDMMNFKDAPPGWEELFHDYGMSLFCANEVEDLSVFKTGLRQLLQVIPRRKDKAGLAELFAWDEYRHLDRDTAKTIAILTDNTTVLERLDEYETEGGYDMCQAMDELQQDWLAAGMERGMMHGIESTLISAISNLMETMKLTAEQAMDALKVPEEERARYLANL